MAAYSVESSKIGALRMEFGSPGCLSARSHGGFAARAEKPRLPVVNFLPNRFRNSLRICCSQSLDAKCLTKDAEESPDAKSSVLNDELFPSSSEIESLVTGICSTTSIAEFELKVGGFQLYVLRKLAAAESAPPSPQIAVPQHPLPVPASGNSSAKAADSKGSASTSLAVVESSSTDIQKSGNQTPDQGLTILTSPTVGVFHTSFTIKGKRLPPCCAENQMVKKGSILGCIEQLSGRVKLRSSVSGEIVQILCKDGEPVGYGDPLIAILPSFPGIKNLLPPGKS